MNKLEKIAFDSFLHSQGDTTAHRHLLKWAESHTEFAYKDLCASMFSIAAGLSKYSKSKIHLPYEGTTAVMPSLTQVAKEPDGFCLEDLTLMLLESDSYFVRQAIRPDRRLYRGAKSPSHIALFGVLKVTTGSEVYDHLYSEITQSYLDTTNQEGNNEHPRLFRSVMHYHVVNNPQDKAAIEQATGLVVDLAS